MADKTLLTESDNTFSNGRFTKWMYREGGPCIWSADRVDAKFYFLPYNLGAFTPLYLECPSFEAALDVLNAWSPQ